MRLTNISRQIAVLLLFALVLCSLTWAQETETHEVTKRQPPDLLGSDSEMSAGHSIMEIALSIGVLVFGAVILLAEITVMLRQNRYWDDWSLKVLGLTLVIVGGLFLIVAGYSQSQSAPMMALLGTVAGYLLGREARPGSNNSEHGDTQ